MKSFPRQSRSRGGGIATVYKSTLGSNITFKTNFDFTHTSFEVVQASITLQYNTLHFFCLYRPPPNRRNNLTDSMITEQLPDLLDYVNNLPGFVCLVGDMNIHFDNPLQSLTKQTLTNLSLYNLVQVINKPTHRCGGGGGVDPIPCVSTHRISDPRSGPAQLLPPHVKQRSHPHGVRPQIPDR